MAKQNSLAVLGLMASLAVNGLIPFIGPIAPLMGLALAMIVYSKQLPIKITNLSAASLCLNLFLIFVCTLMGVMDFALRFI